MKRSPRSRRQHNGPTLDDVATRAGVSPMTVSRVINGKNGVGEESRERVEVAIAALNYAPNAAARTLAGGSDIRIGLLYHNPSFAYLGELLIGSLDEASRSNVQLVVEKCEDAGHAATAIAHLVKGRVDGIVLPPPLSDSLEVLAAVERAGLPIVAVATGRAPGWAMSVSIDDRRAAYEMTRHLGALGHARIGFIAGNPDQAASGERLAGHRAALVDLGLPDLPELTAPGLFTYRSGLDAAELLLDLDTPPTAIFAANDDMAAATVAVAHSRGLDIPGDLTVCGFDDTPLATTIWPELTTIRQPVTEMARIAIELLVSATRAEKAGAARPSDGSHVIATYTLIRRQSDAAPRRRPRGDGQVHLPQAQPVMAPNS